MFQKTVLFLTVLSYSVIVSQAFMYLLALRNTQLALGGSSYTEVRQLIDANMKSVLTYVVYAALLSNLLLVLATFKNPGSFAFITACIAFLALVIDVILTMKVNMSLNEIINGWSPQHPPAGWVEVRRKWFAVFTWRQAATITGFIALIEAACGRPFNPV